LVVEFGEFFVPAGDVLAVCFVGIPGGLGVGAYRDQRCLLVGGVVGFDDQFLVEVPALAALRGPEVPGPVSARRAHAREGVPARDEHGFCLAGGQVSAP
jgi:hypothetical protein